MDARTVNTAGESTLSEKILLTAYQLDEQQRSPFSAETLVVAAWLNFPHAFGLQGYSDLHPDSNKVLSSVVGEKGLARRGWLSKRGPKLYALTHDGKQVVHRLQHGAEAASTSGEPRVEMPTTEKEYLARGRAEALLHVLRKRFPPAVPADVEQVIWATRDLEQFGRWLDDAVTVRSMSEFRRATGLVTRGDRVAGKPQG
jgi:hypothetical protein